MATSPNTAGRLTVHRAVSDAMLAYLPSAMFLDRALAAKAALEVFADAHGCDATLADAALVAAFAADTMDAGGLAY